MPAFVADNATWFARTAYLLTGDRHRAERLATNALIAVGRRWSTHRLRPTEAVLRELYQRALAGPPPPQDAPLAHLSPMARVAWVAQFHDRLTLEHAAQLVGVWPGVLQQETAAAVAPDGQELMALASELPGTVTTAVIEAVPRAIRVRHQIWRGAFTAVGAGSALAIALVLLIGLRSAVLHQERQQAGGPAVTESPELPIVEGEQPDQLPDRVKEPIARVYQGYCNDTETPIDPRQPPECAQWRLVGSSGAEWRLKNAQADRPHDGSQVPEVGISLDGHRVAYLDRDNDYVVRDLVTGADKRFAIQVHGSDPAFVSSRNGRYFAVNFLQSGVDSPMLDFAKGTTTYDAWTMAITDDGRRVIDLDMAGDTPRATKIKIAGHRFRVDAEVGIEGSVLSPDGRMLASSEFDERRVVVLDTRTGKVTKLRRLANATEILAMERWLNGSEVLVRLDEDDDVAFRAVNVRTGKVREVRVDDLEYGDILGAFAE
ncbi:MAG: hypothetical protein HOY71_02710 [Nonomuraea sp.]|nr:hypothetical protein [Nonomuraea sp.]